ncbi:MAG: hypothetical protein GX759_08065 [Thermoanaerobacterales bacterium]|jgi:small acid-soluble spore protein F (minor alpha/beta-type SASP)|nr:hypothetical protein [Thermoanaerobacterales bacterium]
MGKKRPRNPKLEENSFNAVNEMLKIEAAAELGLLERARLYGWNSLTASETGKLGALIKKKLAKTDIGHTAKNN